MILFQLLCQLINITFHLHAMLCSVAKLYLTLCNPMDCSPLDSSGRGISQARIRRGLPFPPPGDLPGPGIKPESPTLAGEFFTTGPYGKSLSPPYHPLILLICDAGAGNMQTTFLLCQFPSIRCL